MELIQNKKGNWICKLTDFPTEDELKELNDKRVAKFFICEDMGYKRLLSSTLGGLLACTMECPIGQKFTL